MKSLALRLSLVGGVALALAAACGSDEEGTRPTPVVPKDARADVPAEARNDTGADARDASADVSMEAGDAGADTSDAADTSADSSDSDTDASDAGSDASDAGGEADAALPLSACPSVGGSKPVAGSPDGTSVAFLSCAKSSPAVVVYKLATREQTELGPAPAASSVEWLLDGKHVYYGTANEAYVRAADLTADGAGPPVRISTGVINDHSAFLERVSSTAFEPRLMVLETEGSIRRISVRKPDDGYSTRLVLIEDATLALDISQLSDSGRTLIATVTPEGGTPEYKKIRTNLAQLTTTLPFGPNDWVMAPTGLGDTHNFALKDDRLVRIQIDNTGSFVELVPAGSGLLAGTEHLLEREESPGVKYVHFIQNGDPSRRIREGTAPIQVLATANAVAQAMSRDLTTVLYLSDQQLFAVSSVGGAAARPLVTEPNTATTLNLVFSETTRDVAYLVGPKLFRISLANDAVQPLSTTANPASVKFDGLGQSILFMTDAGALQRVAPTASTPETLEPSVQGFSPVPGTANVAVTINGQLVIRSLTP